MFSPSLSGQRLCDNVTLDLKKETLLSLCYCFCFYASSMASNLPAVRSPCATAPQKYTSTEQNQRKQEKKSNYVVGRTVLCIFGLKSQMSGKQSFDCLVCVGYSSPHSSVTYKQGSKLFVSARMQV